MILLINTVLNAILSVVAAAVCSRRAYVASGRMRVLYVIAALTVGYYAIIYSFALLGILNIRDIGPDYLRPAYTVLVALLIAVPIAEEPDKSEINAREIIDR